MLVLFTEMLFAFTALLALLLCRIVFVSSRPSVARISFSLFGGCVIKLFVKLSAFHSKLVLFADELVASTADTFDKFSQASNG